jgi:NAD/NADP transhydrogenase alpha subunit
LQLARQSQTETFDDFRSPTARTISHHGISEKKDVFMSTRPRFLIAAGLGMALAPAFFPGLAEAAGCLKGAVVGGVAGHYAGHHAVAGAIGGCIVGHHMAAEKKKQDAAAAAAHHDAAPTGQATPTPQ